MAKTNFTKVEEALIEGLRKITVHHLLDLADLASDVEKRPTNPEILAESQQDQQVKQNRIQLIHALSKDLKELNKHDSKIYSKMKFKHSDLKKILEHPESLSPEEWERIKKVKEQVENYKAELLKNLPQSTDEDLVERERKKHINKRFNTNDKWLPLH